MNLIEKNFSIEGMYGNNRCHGDVSVMVPLQCLVVYLQLRIKNRKLRKVGVVCHDDGCA